MMEASSLGAWLALQSLEGVGDQILLKLVQAFGSPGAALKATQHDLIRIGCSLDLAESIRRGYGPEMRRQIDRQLKLDDELNIRAMTLFDRSYPTRLRTISDPPPLLYVRGTLLPQDDVAVAIVGGRRATPSGRVVTEEIAPELAGAGVTVVSSLAYGIDAAAHRGALAGKGRTIAVLGAVGSTELTRRTITRCGGVLNQTGP